MFATKNINRYNSTMLMSPGSPEGPCVDAARDSMYCPQDIVQVVPRAAPRGNPPTPKPRGTKLFTF